ncbi:MAG: hypothetical protein AB8Z22_03610 [Coxiella-like endosymbiont]
MRRHLFNVCSQLAVLLVIIMALTYLEMVAMFLITVESMRFIF